MMRMRLSHFNLIAADLVKAGETFYLLGRFEIDLNGNHTLYGVGTLRIQPKADSIEYALSSDGAIYLDAAHTRKVGLSEFLQ